MFYYCSYFTNKNLWQRTLSHLPRITQRISGKVDFESKQSSLSLEVTASQTNQQGLPWGGPPLAFTADLLLIPIWYSHLQVHLSIPAFRTSPGGWVPVLALCLLGSIAFSCRYSSPPPKARYLWSVSLVSYLNFAMCLSSRFTLNLWIQFFLPPLAPSQQLTTCPFYPDLVAACFGHQQLPPTHRAHSTLPPSPVKPDRPSSLHRAFLFIHTLPTAFPVPSQHLPSLAPLGF